MACVLGVLPDRAEANHDRKDTTLYVPYLHLLTYSSKYLLYTLHFCVTRKGDKHYTICFFVCDGYYCTSSLESRVCIF